MPRFMRLFAVIGTAVALAAPAGAQEVGRTPDIARRSVMLNGEYPMIERIQDTANLLLPEFTKISRPCPPFCIAPISATPGVATIGEFELIDFPESRSAVNEGLLIDSRVPGWFHKGTIPGAVNVPFSTLESANPNRDDILKALGARQSDTETLLARLVKKSPPSTEAKTVAEALANSKDVDTRVVQRAGETKQYNFYTVQQGGRLGATAEKFYGNANRFKAIFDANRTFLSIPDAIRPGQRPSIPAISSS